MVNKKTWLGILVIVLIFGMTVFGCEDLLEDKGYTFEFKIRNDSSEYWGNIIKVEFINGNNYYDDDPILETHDVNIAIDETSEVFKVSGFTNNRHVSEDLRNAGVRLTFDNAPSDYNPYFVHWFGKNNQKFLVYKDSYALYYWSIAEKSNW
jgi:hypothetical protein